MLNEMKRFGQYLRENNEYTFPECFVKNGDYDGIVGIRLKETDDGYEYDGVELSDPKRELSNLLYKTGEGNYYAAGPTSRIQKSGGLKLKLHQIFTYWYRSYEKYWERKTESEDPKHHPIATALQKLADSEDGQLEAEIKQALEDVSITQSDDYYVTIQIVRDETILNPADVDFFRDVAGAFFPNKEWVQDSWSTPSSGTCNYCGEEGDVYPKGVPFSFFSVDDARLAPNFEEKRALDAVALCETCIKDLGFAEAFLREQPYRWWYGSGQPYFVLPVYPAGNVENDFIARSFLNPSEHEQQHFLKAEKLHDLEGDYPLQLDFIVYEQDDNGRLPQIHRYINEVIPSWIAKVDKKLSEGEDNVISRIYPVGCSERHWDNPFENIGYLDSLIARVVPDANPETNSNEAYFRRCLDWTEAVMKQESLPEEQLLTTWNRASIQKFQRNERYQQFARYTFVFLQLLNELGLLESRQEVFTMSGPPASPHETERHEPLEEHFQDHETTFKAPGSRAAFAMGVLTQTLMDVQRDTRNLDYDDSAPFQKKLSNLRLTQKRLRELLPAITHNLEIYNRKADYPARYPRLCGTASHYLIEAENNEWAATDNNRLQYYFTLGMSMNQRFKASQQDD